MSVYKWHNFRIAEFNNEDGVFMEKFKFLKKANYYLVATILMEIFSTSAFATVEIRIDSLTNSHRIEVSPVDTNKLKATLCDALSGPCNGFSQNRQLIYFSQMGLPGQVLWAAADAVALSPLSGTEIHLLKNDKSVALKGDKTVGVQYLKDATKTDADLIEDRKKGIGCSTQQECVNSILYIEKDLAANQEIIKNVDATKIAIDKFYSFVDELSHKVMDTKTYQISNTNAVDALSALFVKTLAAQMRFPCGVDGSVQNRIDDCKSLPQIKSYGAAWGLVSRVYKDDYYFTELWQDSNSGLLWTDNVQFAYTGQDAAANCTKLPPQFYTLAHMTWSLATRNEAEDLLKEGPAAKLQIASLRRQADESAPKTNIWTIDSKDPSGYSRVNFGFAPAFPLGQAASFCIGHGH